MVPKRNSYFKKSYLHFNDKYSYTQYKKIFLQIFMILNKNIKMLQKVPKIILLQNNNI